MLLPLAFGLVRGAAAEPTRAASATAAQECLDAYSEGQRARKQGEFGRARGLLAACGGASCPTALHGDCQRWLSEVEAATPTAVFRLRSPGGEEIQDARLSTDDGEEAVLDGRAIQFDPGEHWLEFRAPGFQTLRRKQSFAEGKKLVNHTVELQPLIDSAEAARPATEQLTTPDASGDRSSRSATAASETRSGGSNLPLWLGVGVAAAGVGGFSYFGLTARREEKALAACSPNCTNARVDAVERDYLLANVSLGVGVVGLLGAAAWLVFTPGDSASEESTAMTTDWRLNLGSNSVTISGSF